MEKIYYVRRAERRQMLYCMFGYGAVTLVCLCVAILRPSDRNAFAFFSFFWGAWFAASVIVSRYQARFRLMLNENRVSLRGLRSEATLTLRDVSALNWQTLSGAIKLRSDAGTKKSISIQLRPFEDAEQLEIIRFLRANVPEALQQNWPLFCHGKAIRLRDFPPDRQPGPGEIRVTRRRMDAMIAVFFLACIPLGIAAWWTTGQPSYLAMPLASLPFALFRFTLPKSGSISPRMHADWRTTRFFLGMLAILSTVVCWSIARGPHEPLTWPDYIFAASAFAVIFALAGLRGRQERRDNEMKAVDAVRQWDAGEAM